MIEREGRNEKSRERERESARVGVCFESRKNALLSFEFDAVWVPVCHHPGFLAFPCAVDSHSPCP